MRLMRRCLMVAVLLACCLFVFQNQEQLTLSHPGVYALTGPANVRADAQGGLLVVDNGNAALLRVNGEGIVDLVLYRGEFDAAVDAASDSQGNLYVLDLVRSGSRQLLAERVLKFSPDGRLLEEVYRVEHGDRDARQRLVHIACRRDGLLFVELREDDFVIHTGDGTAELEQQFITYPNALSLIWQFASGASDGELVGLDKQGRVFRVEGNRVETLYNAPDYDPRSIPGDVALGAIGPESGVLLTDLGLRQISLVEEGSQRPIYTGEDDFLERIIFPRLDAGPAALAASSEYGILLLDGQGGERWIEEFPVSTALMVRRILVWGAVAVGALILLRLLWLGGRALLRHRGRVLRVSVAVLSGALLLSTVFSLIVMKDVNQRLIREKLTRLTTAAQLTAKLVPTDAFQGVQGVEDYLGEDYRRVQDSVRDVFLGEGGLQEDMYGVLYGVRNQVGTVIYATEENSSLYPYDWEYAGSNMEQIMLTGVGEESTDYTFSEGDFIYTLQPIFDGEGAVVGVIEMGADMKALHRENRAVLLELYLNILSISVVIVLVVTELAVFLEGRRERAGLREDAQAQPRGWLPVGISRMGVFLVFFLSNLCTAFLPLYAMSLLPQEGAAGRYYEQLVALPLSADVLFGALAVLFGHRLNRRLGTRRTGLLSAALFAVGMVMKCVPSYGALIVGSAVFGLGWGLLLLLCNLNMAAQPSPEAKNSGFAGYTASMLSGVNCGVAVGAFLLNWFAYGTVLRISAVLGLLVPVFVAVYFRGLSLYSAGRGEEGKRMGTLRFLCSPRILLFFAALVLPMLACGYFLNYLYPIVGFQLGISEVNIGYTFLLYNLLIVCFGRPLMSWLSRRVGKVSTLVLWGGVYGGAFLLFARLQTVPALLGALALLGLADGFGLPLYTSYYTDLPQVEALGQDRAIGMLGVVENVAQTAGPFLFSMVLRPGGWRLELVAGGLLLAVVVFGLTSLLGGLSDRRQARGKVVQTR